MHESVAQENGWENRVVEYGIRHIPRKVAYAAVAVLAAIVAVLLLPISLSRSINVAAQVLPAREWLLVKNQEGGLLATYSTYLHGGVESYTALTTIRGDAFLFALEPSLSPGGFVNRGDTVVRNQSHELTRELNRLKGDLAIAKATLSAVRTGEKVSIVDEAERGLALAKERYGVLIAAFERRDSLYRRALISQEEFEIAQGAAQQAALEVAMAETRLQTVRTGSKPEQIRMIESQIAGLQRDIKVLADQVSALILVSPIAGVLFSAPGSDTLCSIEDTTRIALIPVPVEYLKDVAPRQLVSFSLPPHGMSHEGSIARLDRRVRTLNGRQVFMAIARLDGTSMGLPSGLVVVGSIETEKVSLACYIESGISDFLTEVVSGTPGI